MPNNTAEGVHGQDAALRPDIVVRDDANRRITIVNIMNYSIKIINRDFVN